MSLDVTELPSLDWVREVPADISVKLIKTTAARIVVALWSDKADAHVAIEYEAFGDPIVAVRAAVTELTRRAADKAAADALVREATKPKLVLVH